MKQIYCFVFVFLQILIFVNANGFYSILAPDTIQSHQNYSVSITLHENSEPATIKVGIEGPLYNESQAIEVLPTETKVVNFELPELGAGYYKLQSVGLKGLLFKKVAALNLRDSSKPNRNVFIQTDKLLYKQGDLVQYRILVLDKNTRPAKIEQSLNVYFKDGAGNIVKRINDIQLTKGVYTGELQLSGDPEFGQWLISASFNGERVEAAQEFKVDKYVLPKFSFDIETAENIVYNEPIKIRVRGRDAYGKPLKGKAVITIDRNELKSEKVTDVNGTGQVEFNVLKDLEGFYDELVRYGPQTIKVLAVLTEANTGEPQSKTANINLHATRYTIEINDYGYEYYANKPLEIRAFVKHLDGSPVLDSKHVARLSVGEYSSLHTGQHFVFTSELDKNGMALFKVVLPMARKYTNILVEFDDCAKYLEDLFGSKEEVSKDGHLNGEEDARRLQLIAKTEGLQVGDDVVVEVKSNRSIPYYNYALVKRGQILKQEFVKLPENVKSHEIKFKYSFEMLRESYVYVYFVLDGDFICEEIAVTAPVQFQNKIEITAPRQAKPGEEVTLQIKTDPDSFVGLLAVDQTLPKRRSYDHLKLNIIDSVYEDSFTPSIESYENYPGKSSGLVTLTNAKYPTSKSVPFNRMKRYFVPRFAIPYQSYSAPAIAPMMSEVKQINVPKIREIFTDSWIFNNINNTDENGLATFTKNIPDSLTSWAVTGFSLNEKSGFGFVDEPSNIEVFQPFFITTYLPHSVKRDEHVTIPVFLHNYMDKALDTEVIIENTDAEYEFIESSDEDVVVVLEDKQKVKRVTVPANSDASASFLIRTTQLGDITLKIKAISPLAGDAIRRVLKVKPEGIINHKSQVILVTPSDSKEPTKITLHANIPEDAVSDSEYLEISVSEDILAPMIRIINNLVAIPGTTPKENMFSFMRNLLVLQYLEATKREMPVAAQQAKKFMELGYQWQLQYKHTDGGFGITDSSDCWLTAYVARAFIQARKYITVDAAVINDAFKFVISNQLESGQFSLNRVDYTSESFTAFVLLTLLEDKEYSNKYNAEIEKGLKYLLENIKNQNNTYALALTLLVLTKKQHSSADILKGKMESLAVTENGFKRWITESESQWNYSVDHGDKNIEVTAYILEAYVHNEPAEKLLPIIRFLVESRSVYRRSDIKQGTVATVQALTKFAEKYVSDANGKTTIKFEAQDSEGKETTTGSFSLDQNNSLTMQTHVLPKSTRQITLEAEGLPSQVRLSYRYNLVTKESKSGYSIKHTSLEDPSNQLLALKVCASNDPLKKDMSNKMMLEIDLPSGYTFNKYRIGSFDEVEAQRVTTDESNTIIYISLDFSKPGEEVCLNIKADQTYPVANQKPVAIALYSDYTRNDPSQVIGIY